jgi:hypothetical protein
MAFFELYLFLTFVVVSSGVVWGTVRYNDTLHPLIFLMPAAGFMYVIRPWSLYRDGALDQFFLPDQLAFVQGFNLACVTALAVGCIAGSRGLKRDPRRVDQHHYLSTPAWNERLFQLAIVLGGLGLLVYVYGLYNVGGFVAAYDAPKGGGWAATGYLRDFSILVVPAIILLFMSRRGSLWRARHAILLIVFSSPLLIHGLLSARRGPTFMGIASIGVSWYLNRHDRPSLWQMLAAGFAVGVLLLVLVTFRSQIYLGSSFLTGQGPSTTEIVEKSLERTDQADYGNEFVYGSFVLLGAGNNQSFYWGRRYLTYIFIRPIPSALWPSKYSDVGMEDLRQNAGTLVQAANIPVEQLPKGAAPGFAADLYLEFWWFAVAAAFGIGWIYGVFWRRNLTHGGWWRIVFAALLVFSLYLITQTMEAALFRFLEVLIPTSLGWAMIYPQVHASRRAMSRPAQSGAPFSD